MEQQVIEAILEDGQIKSVSRKLPSGTLKVHLIYDKKNISDTTDLVEAIAETAGIYKTINVDDESRKLRSGWDRNNGI